MKKDKKINNKLSKEKIKESIGDTVAQALKNVLFGDDEDSSTSTNNTSSVSSVSTSPNNRSGGNFNSVFSNSQLNDLQIDVSKLGNIEPAKKEFVKKALPLAKECAEKFNLPLLGILGQACVESGWGTSNPARTYNAYFGIKYPEYDAPYHIKNRGFAASDGGKFRIYPNMRNSFLDYGHFIHNHSRYRGCISITDPKKYITCVKNAGYAPENGYEQLVHSVIDMLSKAVVINESTKNLSITKEQSQIQDTSPSLNQEKNYATYGRKSTNIFIAIDNSNINVIEKYAIRNSLDKRIYFEPFDDFITPLMYATYLNNLEVMHYLISIQVVNPNEVTREKKIPTLFFATTTEALRKLQSAGVDINQRSGNGLSYVANLISVGDITSLIYRKKLIENAIIYGVDLNIKEDFTGYTPLYLLFLLYKTKSPYNKKIVNDLLLMFIQNGANVNLGDDIKPLKENFYGFSPLMLAIKNNNLDAAKLLIKNGADINYKTSSGINALKLVNKLSLDKEYYSLFVGQDTDRE